MAIGLSTVTGASVTGLTSPTYTMALDLNMGSEKSWVVTANNGTQTGVNIHSNSNPFSLKVQKTKNVKGAPIIGPNGQLKGGGYNVIRFSVIKGVVPLAGQAPQIAILDCSIRVPAGADVSDKANLAAALSLFAGFANANATGLFDLAVTNTI